MLLIPRQVLQKVVLRPVLGIKTLLLALIWCKKKKLKTGHEKI